MKNILSPKTDGEKNKKMTLKGYYKSLPLSYAPRKRFIADVARLCCVSEQTVRNWCLYGIKPQSYAHVKILMDLTGLKEEELWRKD